VSVSSPTAVVTGAAGVIGGAICRALATSGYRVAGLDSLPAPIDTIWHHVVANLDEPGHVASAFDEVSRVLGAINVLVNNAGRYLAVDFLDTTPEQFSLIMASNVGTAFMCSQQFASRAISAKMQGAIVNVASVSGRIGSADCAYGASKGAVIALTRSLAGVLGPHGIRVNAVAPGIVVSDMSARIPADRREHYLNEIPIGRYGQPEEIASVVVFLAGPTSSYMVGAIVDVNGGLW
jgi:NAD(P)-dependent dehydrogenase (short-subunit alcohol dehydrogenase family)